MTNSDNSDKFFKQIFPVNHYEKRLPCFINFVKNSDSVLHVGCADWPITNENNNLHIQLFSINNYVDGYDINKDSIEKMKTMKCLENAKLYYELPDKKYKIILIPEVIEHVNNVEDFLLSFLKCISEDTEILITAPNAFCDEHYNRNQEIQGKYVELVHPDHNCWYSPYTLANTIRKVYKNVTLKEIGTFENKTMVFCLFKLNL